MSAMVLGVIGQRCVSEREPELGLGMVAALDGHRITIAFPATGETRLYARHTGVLQRVVFRVGDTVRARDGRSLVVEAVDTQAGLLVYQGQHHLIRENEIADITSVSSPPERLLSGQSDAHEVFDLRLQALQTSHRLRQSPVRGLVGARVQLIPHQFYILHEVAQRQIPRILLADEVGLGKTIEACLIVQRLLAVGKAQRVLVLVPESLTHQWFVELLRRFNLWFSIYDEDRCVALEESEPAQNPFLCSQLGLASIQWLAASPARHAQAVSAGWDVVVVDEAHHLAWTPAAASAEYQLAEALARVSPGLLLLTATPTQLGLPGHFARLRLLDPERYPDYEAFVAEHQRYAAVAQLATQLVEQQPLSAAQEAALAQLLPPAANAPEGTVSATTTPAGRSALLLRLLDQHGTGRVMFRNTRARMTGFPRRQFCPAALEIPEAGGGEEASVTPRRETVLARVARELVAEESGTADAIRYNFRKDPRIVWLAELLREHRASKFLLICKSPRKVAAIEAALREEINVGIGLFHEGLPLIQRDRQAAWFADPEGAQLLLCSEIGSEGRNFQFAHHLVLFDLPLNPGILEQRIGRLDRIGQTETIRVHVPYLAGSSDEVLVRWYHEALDAFATPLQAGDEYAARFGARLRELAAELAPAGGPALERLLAETHAFRQELNEQLRQGRDRLLELNSFRPAVAEQIIAQVREVDAEPRLREFLLSLLDHFGVRVKEHEEGDLFLDPSHAYIEAFPSLPAEGLLATFRRPRALSREDIAFLSADHPLVRDALDLLINSPTGTTAFGTLVERRPNLLLEAVYVLEAVADTRWHVDQFLAPTPLRVVVDVRGEEVTNEYPSHRLTRDVAEAPLARFLEQGTLTAALLRQFLASATACAETQSEAVRASAGAEAQAALQHEVDRLLQLQKVNNHIRPEEIALARHRLERTRDAITAARLRLDALRLIVVTPDPALLAAGSMTPRRGVR